MTLALLAFVNSLALNLFFGRSVQALARRDRWAASNWTAAICAASIITTLVVIQRDMVGIAGTLIGAWVGTFVSVKPVEAADDSATRMFRSPDHPQATARHLR